MILFKIWIFLQVWKKIIPENKLNYGTKFGEVPFEPTFICTKIIQLVFWLVELWANKLLH